jgi:hypothetical protein
MARILYLEIELVLPTGCQLRTAMELETLVRRVRGEFLEMPGLQLTIAQAQRLWGMERELCERVVGALVGASFLRRTPTGAIARMDV